MGKMIGATQSRIPESSVHHRYRSRAGFIRARGAWVG